MKHFIIFCNLTILSFALHAQKKSSPFTFRAEARTDLANNFQGGSKTGGGIIGRLDLSMELSTEKAGWFKGGTFFIHALTANGATPSFQNVKDIQPVSRIEATNRLGLFEFWYRQDFGKLSLVFGQLDMNATFATNNTSGNLLNTSFGMYPSVALNVPVSIYPR